jgi:hypothetical protein
MTTFPEAPYNPGFPVLTLAIPERSFRHGEA